MTDTATPKQRNSQVRDIVTMGIFIALYLVCLFFFGMIMGFIPIVMVLLPILLGLFGGLIITVLLGKVQRPGAFLITSVLIGLFLISMAPGGTMCYMTIIGGLLAELIHSKLGRRSFRSMCIAYAVFIGFFALGEYIPFVWMKDAYLAMYSDSATLEVARAGVELLNPLLLIVFTALGMAAGVLGCLWGRALTRKQFAKAGIV